MKLEGELAKAQFVIDVQGELQALLPKLSDSADPDETAPPSSPKVTLQTLRAFSLLPQPQRPPWLLESAHSVLDGWRQRHASKPYQFGHGRQFATVKWSSTWYRVNTVLDALGRYPRLWQAADADPDDRTALAELLACLLARNVDEQGRALPRSTYRGFTQYSFGQKEHPSPFATAHILATHHRYDDLAGLSELGMH